MLIDDFFAPHLTDEELEQAAVKWRKALNYFFIAKNLDVFALFRAANELLKRPIELVVQADPLMGRATAYVSKDRKKLFVRKSLIDQAQRGDPRAIFDAVHELAHIVLHPAGAPLARMLDGNIKLKHIPQPESAEYQANYFARAFLMSLEEIALFPVDEALASECHVPIEQAKLRLKEMARLPKSVRPRSAGFERLPPRQSTGRSILPPEIAKLVAWETAPLLEGKDPSEYRLIDAKWTIRMSRFGMQCVGGWTVRDGKAIPWEQEE